MADKKTYYYLKLKEGFFDSEDMLLLQGMKDGYIYSDILLKLYLMSLRQDGRLMYRGIIPYTPDMVATITHHQVGTVEKAMKVLTSMGFIEILDNGAIYMLDIQNFIGRSSNEADRKREYRATINAEKSRIIEDKEGQMSRQMSDVRAPENRDKRTENKDNKDNKNISLERKTNDAKLPPSILEAKNKYIAQLTTHENAAIEQQHRDQIAEEPERATPEYIDMLMREHGFKR